MIELKNFEIEYSIKALTEDKKWYEKMFAKSKTNILATTKEIAIELFNNGWSKEEGIECIINNIKEVSNHEIYGLQAWAIMHEPKEEMIYKDGYWKQILFIRDTIPELFAKNFEQYKEISENIKVINTHCSKSIALPVYYIHTDKIDFILRNNFYDWKVTVMSNEEITVDFKGLFKNEKISNVYCEGFPEEFVLGTYEENNKNFTIELRNNYELYTFMFLLSKA